MRNRPSAPPLEGLRRQIKRARSNPASNSGSGRKRGADDSFIRETFLLDRQKARDKAREWFDNWPKAAYWTSVESWRQLPDDRIEFTMRRLPSAD